MSSVFIYNTEFQILVCTQCKTCIQPNRKGQTRHLYSHPHYTKGDELKNLLGLFDTYQLNPGDHSNVPHSPVSTIEGLKTHDGYKCAHCSSFSVCISRRLIEKHVSKEHKVLPKNQEEHKDWLKVTAQTFFAEKARRRYFEVLSNLPSFVDRARSGEGLDEERQSFLRALVDDERSFEIRAGDGSSIVGGFDVHKSEAIPWLERTGIEQHLRGLPKSQILDSYRLPQRGDKNGDLKLAQIIEATDAILNSAHATSLPVAESGISWASMLVLSKFSTNGEKSKAFLPKKSASSLKAYFGYWKHLIAYCWTTMYADTANEHFSFSTRVEGQLTPNDITLDSNEVRGAWVKVAKVAEELEIGRTGDEVSTGRNEALKDLLMEVFVGLICRQTGGNRYQSPIISFAAMLAVKPTTKTWHEPGDFNSKLSGIIWVSQLLLFHHCARQETMFRLQHLNGWQPDEQYRGPSTHDLLKKVCEKYMKFAEETPMGELLGWRALLFAISLNSSRRHQAYWDKTGNIVTYGNTSIRLEDVKTLFKVEHAKALDLLNEQLLFGSSNIAPIAVPLLQDNMDDETIGTWFYHSNRDAIDRETLFREFEKHPAISDRFIRKNEKGDAALDLAAIRVYEGYVQMFLRALLVLIHIGAGQPVRSSEILSTKWKNTANQRRNIIIRHHKVMMHLTYHKGLEKTAQSKDNIRFLPGPIGDLLVKFLVYVQPLRQMFLRRQSPETVLPAFLWQKDGKVWDDEKLSECLKESCHLAGVPVLNVSTWRQMTVAIVMKRFSNELYLFDVDRSRPGIDGEGQEDDIGSMATQRNHTRMTANMSYASQDTFGGVWDEQLQNGYRASMLWSNLFQIESMLKLQAKRQRSGDCSDFEENALSKRLDAGRPRKKRAWSRAQLLEEGRRVFHDPGWKWKTSFQASAMEIVMQRREAVIVVCPTGGGKSMLFMLPSLLPGAHTTIIILPLVSLRGDMIRRLSEQSIRFLQWSPGERRQAPLIVASAEAACSTEFQSYAQSLVGQNRLDRIVIDECHMTLTASEYRQSMFDLGSLRLLATPFVYLTATLPPSMYEEFVQQNHLFQPRVVRTQVNRPSIAYAVFRHPPESMMMDHSAQEIRSTWRAGVGSLGFTSEDKGIIYCQTKEAVRVLAGILGCTSYTSESGVPEVKEDIIRSWLMDPEQPFIVATSALGAGFDYPHIRVVWHVYAPTSMVDFAQETGRAGRDGEPALSVVFLSSTWLPNLGWQSKPATNQGAMMCYLSSQNCLRGMLSGFLDDEPRVLRCRPGQDQQCSNCKACSEGQYRKDGFEELPKAVTLFSGPKLIRERHQVWESTMTRLREWLDVLSGTCLLCRGRGRLRYDHLFDRCVYRQPLLLAKNKREKGKARWFKPFTCCYLCTLPQQYCQPTAREGNSLGGANTSCEYPDMVMPLCWAMWENDVEGKWFKVEFGETFEDEIGYLNWLGQPLKFAGQPAIRAISVIFNVLQSWGI